MKNYKLIPRLQNWIASLALFLASTRIHEVNVDMLHVIEEPQQFYLADGVSTPSELLPFQTAVKTHRPFALNATGTLTAAQIRAGVITSTSAAAVTATLPTATLLATALKAARGTWFDFAVDNSGPNTVTVAVGTGITAATEVVTGGATLTVATGATGLFRIYFTSATTGKLYRVG